MFRRGKKTRVFLRRPALFLFPAAAIVIFATALAVQHGVFRPETMFPQAQVEDWRVDLPDAWTDGAVTSLIVSDDARPTRVIGWEEGAALVVWDRNLGRYAVSSSVSFDSVYPGLKGPPVFTEVNFGAGALPAVMAKVRLGESGRAAIFMKIGSRSLSVIRIIDSKGSEQDAVMRVGGIGNGSADLAIRDVDDDGWQEAVVSSRSYKASGPGAGWGSSVDVYKWQDGKLVYDKQLSWALTMESSIFPEPSAKVDSSSSSQ